ncbi:Fur family transcriptional regulator [Streptomyces griseoviridis]|uniref:Fur family transcriptional regulator n=1 Tax=Streptomyces hintoniae TaxID=3075521 RepID=A0ABU2UUB0_9ACTN|nr:MULTISPECIES: Fur family transcriptional regulator [unclassified Streptomyces]MDH6699280.1 Fe2+ or Zn2+ uptake regulation protein [Streptomyces sp. MAA16]MDT0476650.1 Fur family transcriptional regulator [Streptomyces sp. DSM 41014]
MEEPTRLLRSKGLRSTSQRRAVLAALQGFPHSTASEIEARIGAAGTEASSGLSRQGLYNVLDDLTGARLIRVIEPAGSPARYELRVGDNHHHLACRDCGAIKDVDCAIGAAPCLDPVADEGFLIDEAEITWWGLCARCRPDTV